MAVREGEAQEEAGHAAAERPAAGVMVQAS